MQVSVREAREQLSRLLESVKRGEHVKITRRGQVVAQLAPPEPRDAGQARALVRAELRRALPPARAPSADLLRALREER
ncbi:MAG: type II toxin-antitoxin system prevent-host-death family antitoxin [Nitrococcus sp.]|nr:type II toxin-antitoxin system prevent-host-death family antitoxin [Nitrococcus sp.]